MSTFDSFSLPEPLRRALKTIHYETPTPVQTAAIPVVMNGKDIVGIAQTGTGKTAAFVIPLVSKLLADPSLQALVLAPTRELAMQIYEVVKQLTQNVQHMPKALLIGGASMFRQIQDLKRKPRIVIATPGRLIDHLDQRTLSLSQFRFLVLDEADRMLDIGFEPQLRKIFKQLPAKRQTLLFSATFPQQIERLTKQYLTHPEKISIGLATEPAIDIEQSFVQTTQENKNNVLIQELNTRKGSVLIFTRTKRRTDRLSKLLSASGFKTDCIHGSRTQGQRTRVMNDFRNQKFRILVATDVASRGIDVPHIAHVINYDLPKVSEDYIHRIGRTARAGSRGESLSLVTPDDKQQMRELSRHLAAVASPR